MWLFMLAYARLFYFPAVAHCCLWWHMKMKWWPGLVDTRPGLLTTVGLLLLSFYLSKMCCAGIYLLERDFHTALHHFYTILTHDRTHCHCTLHIIHPVSHHSVQLHQHQHTICLKLRYTWLAGERISFRLSCKKIKV